MVKFARANVKRTDNDYGIGKSVHCQLNHHQNDDETINELEQNRQNEELEYVRSQI